MLKFKIFIFLINILNPIENKLDVESYLKRKKISIVYTIDIFYLYYINISLTTNHCLLFLQ